MNEFGKILAGEQSQKTATLRELTGESLMDCKKALVTSNWDFYQAVEYLRTGQHYRNRLVTPNITEVKRKSIKEQGFEDAGYTLCGRGGEVCIIHRGAVRWLTQQQMFNLMHPESMEQMGT